MLDTGFHQAAGLNSFTPQAQLRVLAVASQERASSGLEMLWQICANLQRLGYPVAVLDGTALETDESPASAICCKPLERWAECQRIGHFGGGAARSQGMLQLQRQAYSGAHRLCRACSPISAPTACWCCTRPAGLLAPLLTHTSTIPLAVMEGGSARVLSCYKASSTSRRTRACPVQWRLCCKPIRPPNGAKCWEPANAAGLRRERHLGGRVRTTTVSPITPRRSTLGLATAGKRGHHQHGPLGTLSSGSLKGFSELSAQPVRSH